MLQWITWGKPDSASRRCQSGVNLSLISQRNPKISVCIGMVGIEGDCFPARGCGFLEISEIDQCAGQVIVRIRVPRIDFKSAMQRLNGWINFTGLPQSGPQIRQRRNGSRIQVHGALVGGERFAPAILVT